MEYSSASLARAARLSTALDTLLVNSLTQLLYRPRLVPLDFVSRLHTRMGIGMPFSSQGKSEGLMLRALE